MNYIAHYEALMARGKCRHLVGYVEVHHMVPRCLGGTDDKSNLVSLTPEEHYVAHQLLVKMHPGNTKLLWAAFAMSGGNRYQVRNNRFYGWLRRKFAQAMSEQAKRRTFSPETRAKMAAATRNRPHAPHTIETRAKMSLASLGKPKSEAHRAALSAAKYGKKLGPQSDAHREARRVAVATAELTRDRSYQRTPEYREKQRQMAIRSWADRKSRE